MVQQNRSKHFDHRYTNKVTFKKVNKHMYANYIASLFANTIATITPKIEIKDKSIQDAWENIILKNNDILKINYQLVYKLSLKGKAALYLTTFYKEPKICVALPIEIEYDKKLVLQKYYFKLFLPEYRNYDYNVIGANKRTSKKKYSYEHYVSMDDYLNRWNGNYYIQLGDNEPFIIFCNNPICQPDLGNVVSKWIDDVNAHLDLLLSDSKTAKSLHHINTPLNQANSDNITKLRRALDDTSETIFENQNLFSLLQSGGLQIQQGVSNYQSILDKLKYYDNKIKDLAFSPRSTLDAGTKNIHSAEANNINSQSDDYVEIKANLLEENWKEFIRKVFFDYLKNNVDEFKEFNFENIEIEVEIAGSTKYLQNRANEYLQTQQGTLINPSQQLSNPVQNEQQDNKQEGESK